MKKIVYVIFLLQTLLSHATETNNGLWYGFFNKSTISKNYSWWTETQLRHNIDEQILQQTLVRTGLLAQYTDSSEFGFLYAYIASEVSKEHRLALQYTYTLDNFLDSTIAQRIRLEYRSRENNFNLPERFRYSLRIQKNLNYKFKTVIWDEIFLNLRQNNTLENDILDINRLFLGFRYPLKETFNIEFGYINQFAPRHEKNTVEHILALYLFLSL